MQNDSRFLCQLASGSPIGIIKNVKNIIGVYLKIAECFDIDINQIMFCTINTHRLDMEFLLTSSIKSTDIIYAHLKNECCHVSFQKPMESLGITLCHNGFNCIFIKHIKDGSVAHKVSSLDVGTQIESIGNVTVAGKSLYDVAILLKNIAIGDTIELTIVKPKIWNVCPTKTPLYSLNNLTPLISGKDAIELGFGESFQDSTCEESEILTKLNVTLENYLGISDISLAKDLWKISKNCKDPEELIKALKEHEMSNICLETNLLYDIFGIISDK